MELKQCRNGHYYDASVSPVCPFCRDEKPMDGKDVSSWKDRVWMLRGCSIITKIGSGSTCDVYRVEKEGKRYALKVIDCGGDAGKLRNAQYEIYLMEKLHRCGSVLQLLDSEILYSGSRAIVFILEKYVASFEDFYKSTDMTVRQVVRLGYGIGSALVECWEAGVAHLDVQPKNIFVEESRNFLLGDFGSSLTVDLLDNEQQLRGTLSYMAPEVYHGRRYSQASEVYALGMVLYTILNGGMLPFTDRMSKEDAIGMRLSGRPLPPLTRYGGELWKVLSRACAYRPEDRYASLQELKWGLLELLDCDGMDHVLSASVKPRPEEASPQAKAAPAAPTPKKAAKKGLFGALASMFQKEPSIPATAPAAATPFVPEGSGDLFDQTAVSCKAPDFWIPETEDLFDTDSFACTMPLTAPCEMGSSGGYGTTAPVMAQPRGGNLFDADSFASTCAPSAAPGGMFDADSFASTMPLAASGGNLFDSDSFANTCAMMPPAPAAGYGAPAPAAPYAPPGYAPTAPNYAPPAPGYAPPQGYGYPPNGYGAGYAPAPGYPQGGYPPVPGYGQPAGYAPPPRVDQVQFSAVAPKEARKGDYSIIQLFMYEQLFRNVVEEAIAMADSPAQEKRSGFHKVRENTRVKIVLTCPDMQIDDNVQEQVWCGGYLQFDFAICPPEELKKRQILLTAAVYFDDIPATRLMLTIKALASYEEEIELARQDILTAFVSYASQDRARVGALVQGMRKARPEMDIFFDVASLRSGEDWEETLYREIRRRDILFLCWSRNAQASPWVEREWRFALENKGVEAIEPIPLEQPDVCPPPRELWSKHFNDSLLYIINR